MSTSKAAIATRLPIRRGLGEAEAALYIGLGASKFRALVEEGTMPRPRIIGTRRIWDVDDIDAAFRALPVEGDVADSPKPNSWDELIP
jgi:predicted DNA-binding transcriptional regulator AlpA